MSTSPWPPLAATVAHNLGTNVDEIERGRVEYERARAAVGDGVVDLSGALDGEDAPTFFDWCHTNEHGARLQAEALWPHVEAALDRAG